jgi:DNA polymerase-4
MHVDLDAFFVAVEQVLDPSLGGKPVIVGGDPNGRGVAATASYEARQFGVRSGMPLSTARRLCPQAVFVKGNYQEYQRVSKAFHAILRDFSPLVESMGLDEAFLDLTGCAPIVEARCGPHALADTGRVAGEAIRARVREELSISASVGIATGRTVAKVASDAAKPDGLLEIAAGEEATFLAPRPVRDLPGLGAKAEEELVRIGVRTLGRLAAMPDARLRALFGKWGPVMGERARGIDRTPVAWEHEPAKSVSREGTYAKDIDDVAVLRASLRGYAESVGADLRRMGRRARCVTLKLRYGDFTTITRSRTLKQPTCSDDEIYQTGAALLAAALEKDGRSVRLLGLGCTNLADDAVQLDLFDDKQERSQALLTRIDRLREKYGRRSVETGRTFFDPYTRSPDWSPERRTGLSSQVGLDVDADGAADA